MSQIIAGSSVRAGGGREPPFVCSGVFETDALGRGGVFLRPGDWLFGRAAVRASTLLGSCVAMVLWAPRLRLGAMCHCLLPSRPGGMRAAEPDGRYGEETGEWLDRRFAELGCPWDEVEASLAGGAGGGSSQIGQSNIDWAQTWAAQRGLNFVQQDVGGRVVRRLTFNLGDGSLTVAHGGRFGGG